MAKLKLQPDPTFTAKVAIPVAGSEPVDLLVTFKHRTRDDLVKFIDGSVGRDASEVTLDCAIGWDLSDEFSKDNLDILGQNYLTAHRAIFDTYIDELSKARAKN